ncbi:alpha/beta hydrolase [Flagellimonas zhangzhouensis]|uniref:Acetyl esterase/lipase n=1 Tax=Flagellimonas zhangzhouensis TaxID=1073328 RepID=A0A1H2VK55_9FLAO|nr:alpha/beta hydrolase [Allomuricauda zhangzhouensis]SDQ07358.1 Acetyl esterase/lipase [Allomuricauda zhangzhouensis]SDW68620.1 Acetyl esterase/lipase [Allomuricauda zhangzhouensis]
MMRNCFLPLLFALSVYSSCSSQDKILFKEIDSIKLYLETYYPETIEQNKDYPALIFFFGGGWKNGNRKHFLNHAKYFSKRGVVCFLADYRTESKNHTTPFESLKDAKSAIRFLRKHASQFNIDKSKIIALGGSAGGHLAAATAFIDDYNEATDDLSQDCRPNALILFNPVIDNGPGGYGYERIGKNYKNFSPLHNIKKEAPPIVIFLGTEDQYIPVVTAQYFQYVVEKIGGRCDLKLYQGEKHGFFNRNNFKLYKNTLLEADKFLVSLRYLDTAPIIKIE